MIEDDGVCAACIGDRVLGALVSEAEECSSCGATAPTCTLSKIADEVDRVFRDSVIVLQDEPMFDGDSDRVRWVQTGDSASTVIGELMGCREAVAEAVVKILHRRHRFSVVVDGDTDWYDDEREVYAVRHEHSRRLDQLWDRLCEALKHESRFFNAEATGILDELVGSTVAGRTPGFPAPVVPFGGPAMNHRLFRARQADGAEAKRRIFSAPAREFGPPPPHLRMAGRMNPAGIAALYASVEPETCVAELRAPVGSEVAIAALEPIRTLRLLDLRRFADAKPAITSVFDHRFFEHLDVVAFLRRLQWELQKAVLPGATHLDYLPTQCIAEYLAQPAFGLDGLMLNSAQVTKGTNVVLFSRSCGIDAAIDEAMSGFDVEIFPNLDSDDSEEPNLTITRRASSAAERGRKVRDRYDRGPRASQRPATSSTETTLRIISDGMTVVQTVSINYALRTTPVVLGQPLYDDEMRSLPF